MAQVDLIKLLANIEDYVLIKKSAEFPNYSLGSDVDLLVMDKDTALQRVVHFYESHFSTNGQLRVTDQEYHCHIDFLLHGKLNVRIDLLYDFGFFTMFSVKRGFFIKIFRDRRLVKIGNSSVYIPAPEDELTIRYFEYLEYFDRYPNKLKHLEYICDVKDQLLRKRFFENTHRFVVFSRQQWKQPYHISQKPKSIRAALANINLNSKCIIALSVRHLSSKVVTIYRNMWR
ncbi:MAG: hypothetical protein SWH78_10120 [Thermodesulfobacteriota bacterium]|nr:hypothetical protein [Thermodesulfobacteriota bacterium]